MKTVQVGGAIVQDDAGINRDAGIVPNAGGWRLTAPLNDGRHYQNAQIDDYSDGGAGAYDFRHRPRSGAPVRLTLTAWVEGETAISGTAGFGFWNHPFSPDARRLRLPRAAWFFFGSPPNDLQLARGVPGHGWKAATLDATTARALSLIPLAPLAVPLLNTRRGYDTLYPPLQRRLGIAERALDPALLRAPHQYSIEWRTDGLRFSIDGAQVLETNHAPRGACGFIAWIDNQYAVVTPQGRMGSGLLAVRDEVTLCLRDLSLSDR